MARDRSRGKDTSFCVGLMDAIFCDLLMFSEPRVVHIRFKPWGKNAKISLRPAPILFYFGATAALPLVGNVLLRANATLVGAF